MKTLTYISGPPGVGKSTVAVVVQRSISGIEYLRGDHYWNRYPDFPFAERAVMVNKDILATLHDSNSSDILCEWVPYQGLFVARLYSLCKSSNRQFLHVILTAPASVLRNRKRERDGDEDIGPETAIFSNEKPTYTCLTFDTEQEEITRIADEISKWILSKKALGKDG